MPIDRAVDENAPVHITAMGDYALRATAELAVMEGEGPVMGDDLAAALGVPAASLGGVLLKLRQAGLLRSQRGKRGGYWLARPASEITLAEVIRVVEGPLVTVRGLPPESVVYAGPAAVLREVLFAARASLRGVLESVTLADVARGEVPASLNDLLVDSEVRSSE